MPVVRLGGLAGSAESGYDGKRRQTGDRLCVLRGPDGVVHGLEEDGNGDAQEQSNQRAEAVVVALQRRDWKCRDSGLVDDVDIVGIEARRNAGFFQFHLQGVIQLLSRLGLVLQNFVVGRGVADPECLLLDLFEAVLQEFLGVDGGVVFLFEALEQIGDFLVDIGLDSGELLVDLAHPGIIGAILGLEVGGLHHQLGLLRAQSHEGRGRRHRDEQLRIPGLGQVVARLFDDAVGFRLEELFVDQPQAVGDQVAALGVDPDQVIVPLKLGDLALRLRGMRLELVQLAGEPVGYAQRALIAGTQVQFEILVDDRLGDHAGLHRIGVLIVNLNQVGIGNRHHLEVRSEHIQQQDTLRRASAAYPERRGNF